MKFFITIVFFLCLSYSSCSDLSKEDILERIGKLEVVIQETLKKVAGDALGLVDDALLQVMKVQASLLKTLAQTVSGLPILSDLLLPTLEKTLEGIEMTVEQTVKKIENLLLGNGTTAKAAYYELSKEGFLDRIGKLEAIIQETLRKVAGHITGAIDEAEIELLKAQSIILTQLKETVEGLPIISDVLLPTLENKLIEIEMTVASVIRKIENMILATTPASGSYYDLSKEGLLERIGKLEAAIQETLKKVSGDALGVVDDALLQVLKVQASLLKTLAQTVSGLPILSDLLLPTLEKTLVGIETTVEQVIKKIETMLLGVTTTLNPPSTIKLTNSRGTTVRATLIPSTTRIVPSSTL